jgi:hypothetical protein
MARPKSLIALRKNCALLSSINVPPAPPFQTGLRGADRNKPSAYSDCVELKRPAFRTPEGKSADRRPAFVGGERHGPGSAVTAFHQHLLG